MIIGSCRDNLLVQSFALDLLSYLDYSEVVSMFCNLIQRIIHSLMGVGYHQDFLAHSSVDLRYRREHSGFTRTRRTLQTINGWTFQTVGYGASLSCIKNVWQLDKTRINSTQSLASGSFLTSQQIQKAIARTTFMDTIQQIEHRIKHHMFLNFDIYQIILLHESRSLYTQTLQIKVDNLGIGRNVAIRDSYAVAHSDFGIIFYGMKFILVVADLHHLSILD